MKVKIQTMLGRSDLNKQKRGFGRSLSFVFVFSCLVTIRNYNLMVEPN